MTGQFSPRTKAISRVALIIAFMGFVILNAATPIVKDLLGPGSHRSLKPLNTLNRLMFETVGQHMTVLVYVALTVAFCGLAWRRSFAGAPPTATQPAKPQTAKPQPMARKANAPGAPAPKPAKAGPPQIASSRIDAVMKRAVGAPPVESKPPVSAGWPKDSVLAFRHVWPPRHGVQPVTFFGGAPFAPPDFTWPVARTATGAPQPLTFMGQIDCSALPPGGNRDWLPESGVLYFFAPGSGEFAPGQDKIAVRHIATPAAQNWREIETPANAGPVEGIENTREDYPWLAADGDDSHLPRSYPRIEMKTGWVAMFDSMHQAAIESENAGAEQLAHERTLGSLVRFHGDPVADDALLSRYTGRGDGVWRPYPAFPDSWMAIDIVAGSLRYYVRRERYFTTRLERTLAPGIASSYDNAEHTAKRWSARAAHAGAFEEPSAADKAAFWEWLEAIYAAEEEFRGDNKNRPLRNKFLHWLSDAAIHSSEALLAHGPRTAARVPHAVVTALENRHRVLRKHMTDRSSIYQHQMLGRGRDIQDSASVYWGNHILLMQLSPDAGLNWSMGDAGAFQYWIKPEDLLARRFDKVVLTFECH